MIVMTVTIFSRARNVSSTPSPRDPAAVTQHEPPKSLQRPSQTDPRQPHAHPSANSPRPGRQLGRSGPKNTVGGNDLSPEVERGAMETPPCSPYTSGRYY